MNDENSRPKFLNVAADSSAIHEEADRVTDVEPQGFHASPPGRAAAGLKRVIIYTYYTIKYGNKLHESPFLPARPA